MWAMLTMTFSSATHFSLLLDHAFSLLEKTKRRMRNEAAAPIVAPKAATNHPLTP